MNSAQEKCLPRKSSSRFLLPRFLRPMMGLQQRMCRRWAQPSVWRRRLWGSTVPCHCLLTAEQPRVFVQVTAEMVPMREAGQHIARLTLLPVMLGGVLPCTGPEALHEYFMLMLNETSGKASTLDGLLSSAGTGDAL